MLCTSTDRCRNVVDWIALNLRSMWQSSTPSIPLITPSLITQTVCTAHAGSAYTAPCWAAHGTYFLRFAYPSPCQGVRFATRDMFRSEPKLWFSALVHTCTAASPVQVFLLCLLHPHVTPPCHMPTGPHLVTAPPLSLRCQGRMPPPQRSTHMAHEGGDVREGRGRLSVVPQTGAHTVHSSQRLQQ